MASHTNIVDDTEHGGHQVRITGNSPTSVVWRLNDRYGGIGGIVLVEAPNGDEGSLTLTYLPSSGSKEIKLFHEAGPLSEKSW